MKIPELDHRSEHDLMRKILSLAGNYTPEWKPNPNDPDVGLVLAKLYAGMHHGTIQRLNRTAEKYHIAFCNFLGAGLMPSESASGYVKFGLSSPQLENGVLVQSGTLLEADAQDETAVFTTLDDVFVSNAEPSAVITTDGEHIRQLYASDDNDVEPDFVLFGNEYTDLNSHELFIGCRTGLLDLIRESVVTIQIAGATEFERAWLDQQLHISYSTENGWEPFDNCLAVNDNVLRMTKRAEQPSAVQRTIEEQTCFWLRIEAETMHTITPHTTKGISIMVTGAPAPPDVVITKIGTAEDDTFYPFDEQPTLFDTVYLASDEALSKSGAQITLEFTVTYPPLPDIKRTPKAAHGWKMIIRKSDISIEEPEIISISSVIWEYYNGNGWKPLPCSADTRLLFNPIEGSCTYTVSFRCPDDVCPITVEAENRRFLRARIVKMEQSWHWNVIYRVPLMSRVTFRYECEDFTSADLVILHDQMKYTLYHGTDTFIPFSPMSPSEPVWYIGFSGKMREGPYRMMIVLEHHSESKMPALRWEYFNGTRWNPLTCFDETEHLAHSGFLTIVGEDDLLPHNLFGQTLSWIRAVDVNGAYTSLTQCKPHIKRMDMNSVSICNQQEMPTEYFSLPSEHPFFTVKLSRGNISSVSVSVNEFGRHGDSTIQEMLRSGIASAEYDHLGVMRRLWVKYTQVESFAASDSTDRHFTLDRCDGVITFGDGRHGMIPRAGEGDHICVRYSIGGGKLGNVPSGAVTRSQRALGLVTEIENPMPLYGGNDMEHIENALRRVSSEFRNGGLCVTEQDYEDITRCIDRSILKVRCCSGCNAEGNSEPGSLTVLIMRSDFTHESNDFYMTQAKLRKELQKRRAASLSAGRLYVIHPKYVRICVNARILASDMNLMYRIKENVRQRISDFIDPITGNFDGNGWGIGELPHRQQIENIVRSVSGVDYVEKLYMRGFMINGQEKIELDLDHMDRRDFCIAVSGEHNIQSSIST